MSTDRPLVVLDVDGPFNPYAAKRTRRPPGYETYRLAPQGWTERRPLRVWLHPRHGDLLGALADRTGAELVWCTTWQDEANTLIAPRVGLPELPVIRWSVADPRWKYAAVLAYAGERTVAWFDDDFDAFPDARDWFLDERARRGARTDLHHVSPRTGLTFADVVRVANWLGSVASTDDSEEVAT